MELRKAKNSAICGLVFLLFSVWMVLYAIPTQIDLQQLFGGTDIGTNSRTAAYFAAFMMGIPSLIQLISASVKYFKLKKTSEDAEIKIDWTSEIRALGVFVLCIAYGALFQWPGYIVATIIIPPVILLVLGDRKWQHYLSVYGLGAVMYVIFFYLLKVTLP